MKAAAAKCSYCENVSPARAIYACDVCGSDVCADCSSGEDGQVLCEATCTPEEPDPEDDGEEGQCRALTQPRGR